MVFSLTILQHKIHGRFGRVINNTILPDFLKRLHSFTQEWSIDIPKNFILEDMTNHLSQKVGAPYSGMLLVSSSSDELIVHKLSNLLQYLSILEVSLTEHKQSRGKRQLLIRITSTSASILPAWFPLSCVLSCFLFWIPFSDLGVNEHYVHSFARQVLIPIFGSSAIDNIDAVDSKQSSMMLFNIQPSFVFFFSFILLPVISAAIFMCTYASTS